ncbi:MAG TPA: hypothetical protein GX004_02280 [Firmicutes bacterium]|jgi:hypothetical protein|nr:hypothetical protein [Bacillota bacterium]
MFKELLEDFFYILLFNFRKRVAHLIQNRNIWHGLLIYQIINMLFLPAAINFAGDKWKAGSLITLPYFIPDFPPEAITSMIHFLPLTVLLLNLVFGPLCFFLLVAILNFTAVLFGGGNGLNRLGAVLGYGHFPFLFATAGIILTHCSFPNVTGMLILLAFLWSLSLKIVGLKQVYSFSWWMAVLVYFMPAISFLVAIVLFLLLAIVFLIPLIMQSTDVSSLLFIYV